MVTNTDLDAEKEWVVDTYTSAVTTTHLSLNNINTYMTKSQIIISKL